MKNKCRICGCTINKIAKVDSKIYCPGCLKVLKDYKIIVERRI